jgi:hypothetical protein
MPSQPLQLKFPLKALPPTGNTRESQSGIASKTQLNSAAHEVLGEMDEREGETELVDSDKIGPKKV